MADAMNEAAIFKPTVNLALGISNPNFTCSAAQALPSGVVALQKPRSPLGRR
jgi:hypothetical protein